MTILEYYLQDPTKPSGDWVFLGLIADWADANNQTHSAECLSWVIRHRKQPYLDSSGSGTWFNAQTVGPGLGDPGSDLPAAIYILLEGGNEVSHYKTFRNAREAEKSLLAAWTKARADGWTPSD